RVQRVAHGARDHARQHPGRREQSQGKTSGAAGSGRAATAPARPRRAPFPPKDPTHDPTERLADSPSTPPTGWTSTPETTSAARPRLRAVDCPPLQEGAPMFQGSTRGAASALLAAALLAAP